jgi:hypothetical protein
MKKKILFSSKEENLSEIFNQISINKFLIVFISILFMLLFHFKASFNEKKIILLVTVKNPPISLFHYHTNIINNKNKHNLKQGLNIQFSNNAISNLSTKYSSEKNLQEQYVENFNLNFLSLVNLNNYLDQNKKIDDFKYWLKKENLSATDYFKDKNFGIYKKNNSMDLTQRQYFIVTPVDLKDTNFLVDYIEFTKTVTLIDFISNLKIILSNIIADYESAFVMAKKINLEYPVGMNNIPIDTISNDLFYKGSKILSEEIYNLEKILKSLSYNQFNYNPIYDAQKNKLESSSSRFPLWLNNLGGLVFGFFLSLMIILFRYIFKKNN